VRVLCVVSGAIASTVGVFQYLNPQANLAVALAIPVALFTASFSASIGMWLYSHITEQAREATFRLEEVYRPLYDELLKVVNDLKSYHVAEVPFWREIDGSNLRELVSPEVAEAMRQLDADLDKHHEVWGQAYFVATNKLLPMALAQTKGRVGNFVEETHPDQPVSKAFMQVRDLLNQDHGFLLDPDYKEDLRFLPKDGRGRPQGLSEKVTHLLGPVYRGGPDVGYEVIKDARTTLMGGTQPSELTKSVQNLVPKGEAARRLVQQRLIRPLP
jgi:hypothetical protein